MFSLSVNIMTYNEERCIKRCIESISELAEEIIIVDTGSTDDTLTIVENMALDNVKIFKKRWNNSFAEIRNFMIEKSSKDIIFQLDADEILNTDILKTKELIEGNIDKNKVLSVVIKDLEQRTISLNTPRVFFRENGFKYYGNVHEQIVNEKPFEEISTTIELLHDGYEETIIEQKKKSKRNLDLLLDMIKKDDNMIWHYYYIRDLKVFNQDNNLIYNEMCDFLSKYKSNREKSRQEEEKYINIEILKIYYDIFYKGEMDTAIICDYTNKYMGNLDYLYILIRLNNINSEFFIETIVNHLHDFEEKSKKCFLSSDGTHVMQELFPLILQMNEEQLKKVLCSASQYAKHRMKKRLMEIYNLL